MYIVETKHDPKDNPVEEPSRFYGLFAFCESGKHVGTVLTAPGGPEADRAFEVHELVHPGPDTLSEWLQQVREEIERQYSARYNVDEDTFYFSSQNDWDEDDSANAAYKGAKLAMQLLQVN